MSSVKKLVLVLIVLAMPGIWLWATRDKTNEPPPPPPPSSEKVAEAVKKMKYDHLALSGRQVVIETTKGRIVAALYEKDAKITTKNFMELVNNKFYDGLVFHRVVPGFVVQTGDPTGTGAGGSKKTIPLETSPKLKHEQGALGMARKDGDLNSANSQFYITLRATPELDGDYAVFGRVIDGMDVVYKIVQGDQVKKIYVCPPGKPAVAVQVGS